MLTILLLNVLIFVFAFQGFRTLVALLSSLNFLEKNQKIINQERITKEIRLFILIPCLNEQKNIVGTLAYFQKICKPFKNVFLYSVTTEVEKQFLNKNYTWDIIQSEIQNNNYDNIHNIHYPYNTGFMSHQLNYAINYLKENCLITESDYIVIYNADSRPHPYTFNWVLNNIRKYGFEIYQQLSTVFQNFDDFGNSFRGLLLKTFAILQTRFSLAHELPRLRRTVSSNSFIKKYSNAHCIGHGLFIPYKKLESLGSFSEYTMTEDIFLGFLIRATGNPIKPIPYLESIVSPTSIWKNLYQKYIWYWGPMYYPYYYQYYKKNFLREKNSFKAFILMVQGMLSAVAWALSGPVLLLALVFGILNINLFLGQILILLIFIYAPVQYFLIVNKYKDIMIYTTGEDAPKRNILEHITIPLLSLVVIVLSSIPPYVSMVMEIYKRLFNRKLKKHKTDSL